MRYILILLIIGFFTPSLVAQTVVPRDVLFLSGPGATSKSWYNFYTNAQNFQYKMNPMNPGQLGQNYSPIEPIATSATKLNTYLADNNKTNVLGIGHDGGGLILRQMAQSNNTNLTGIILDGVPNQGSYAITQMIPAPGAQTSEVENLISNLEKILSTNNDCSLCSIFGSFNELADDVNSFPDTYQEFYPNHPTITNLGTPSIPYAVVWGNANTDNSVVDRLMSSWGDAASGVYYDGYYSDCIRRKLDATRAKIKTAQINAIFNGITGFFKSVAAFENVVRTNSSNGAVSVDAAQLPPAIATSSESAQMVINDLREIGGQIVDLLECERLHAVFNATWNLIVSGGYSASPTSIKTITVNLSPEDCCSGCFGEPEDLVNQCITDCYNTNDCVLSKATISIPLFSTQPHDGLYSKEEQLLDGAANTYESAQTNHFQEQSWAKTGIYFQFLFDGQNLAFKVPK